MDRNTASSNVQGYGDTDSDPTLTGTEGSAGQSSNRDASKDQGQSGSEGGGPLAGEGEMFGEFDNTGVGADLTIDTMNTDERERLLEGGEAGAGDR